MVDLKGQYNKIKTEIDHAVLDCIQSTAFINGPDVQKFATALQDYLKVKKVIPCANGTDALQIAMMALELEPGDEIIVPSFTYIATAEVIGLLGLVPVMVDVDPITFNLRKEDIEAAITSKTKAIVPVHLFGQSAPMEAIMQIADARQLYVIEDTAQAIGATYTFKDGRKQRVGTIGHIGCTSFFPSKNLGCYGDGGAIFTNDEALGEKLKVIANHGQIKKYVHKYIGVNSRLDTIQAAILNVKLKYLDEYAAARLKAADYYDQELAGLPGITTPVRVADSTHVFHQYTLKVESNRDALKAFLEANSIPAMIYYPVPLNEQEAFRGIGKVIGDLTVTQSLCKTVLSLPIHTELTTEEQDYIINKIKEFLKK
ncbi:DegT/DnrJ/EryC1/StrS family aminotransferase [Chitinophaga sp. RAB17]|uniref:DegT/DnrJ/EryC1/StrS family aminotransferase n=1 Tax=Chitinophaga sp. RAB17 TaxID=3233049 RepID=UPI003F8DAB15